MLSDLSLKIGYSSSENDLVTEFYAPCLNEAARYDRAVGYFSSTLYILVGVAYSNFAQRGGKTRLICSPAFTDADIDALQKGYALRELLDQDTRRQISDILANPRNKPIAEFLATLVATNSLEIKVAFRESNSGIFHDKVGIFYDESGDAVSFIGSANETFSAWNPRINHESFEVFHLESGSFHRERVERHIQHFERLWDNRASGLQIAEFQSILREHLDPYVNPHGIDDAAEKVRQIVGLPAKGAIRAIKATTPAPTRRVLQNHQLGVAEAWQISRRGIIDHVTGGGKTVSALEIIRRWIERGSPAIVLVPSDLLVHQWTREIRTDLGDLRPALLHVGAGFPRHKWLAELPDFTRDLPGLGPRIVLTTMASAASDDFKKRVMQGAHLLVVADEVHRIGSGTYRSILDIDAGGRLGLSATPARYGDPAGTAAIFSYFGDILPPPFTIPDAIEAGRLVPYDYHVHSCSLTASEQEEWDRLTSDIQREYVRLKKNPDGSREHSDRFRLLLIRRARITKSAEEKVQIAFEVVKNSFSLGQRWLAYCDSQIQLRALVEKLRSLEIPVFEYHSAMEGSPDETLAYFIAHGGVLVAIKCLDEGIDIPTIDRAVILASSSNAREFIQRRGRVLRRAPEKYSAVIHDLLVVPLPSDSKDVDESRQSILRVELRRALLFAQHARNKGVAHELEVLARQNGLSEIDQSSDVEDED